MPELLALVQPTIVILAILAAWALTVGPTEAQTISDQIGSVVSDQNEIIRRYSAPRKPGTIDLSVSDARKETPPAAARKIKFILRSVTVRGAVTVPNETLRAAWAGDLNKRISLAEVYAIAERIDAIYQREGYFSWAVVPKQDVSSGNVVIILYESYVRKVTIKSAVPNVEERLRPYIDRIVAMRPIRIKEAERVLLLMSDLAGLTIEGVFTRPETPSAGGDLKLDISFNRASATGIFDNFGSDAVGPYQLTGTGTLNDALRLFEATKIVGVTIPASPDELKFVLGSQDVPVGYDGLHVGYSLGHVSSEPGGDLGPLELDIQSTFGTVYANYPFLRTINHSLFGRIELNFKDNSLDASGQRATDEDLRWLATSLNYIGELDKGAISLTGTFGQGLDALGASDSSNPHAPREGVPDDYRFFRADLDLRKEIVSMTTIRLRVAAQYAPTVLPSAVQLVLGGDPYGLAFDGSAASGDSGIASALELGRNIQLPESSPFSNLNVFAFVDYGAIWNHDTGVDYTEAELGSAGVGVAASFGQHLNARAIVAIPFQDSQELADTGTRFLFQLIGSY
ncbi:polypeptide-transport-associated domain protein shlb-type [Mesorhizobium sp. WSM3864]|uniref:ShlB/FhaC/HecB family hemolysin secretion/activation protein n=1 Tax=Mesorhizobium sp. WSM3864 TaxID=2029404 RepID=UPI000BAEA075|nr:ShlB/FhaC/HecB family hemolysin secretion/activation protein [Mesorhizobium sp. WSM3864]PBB94474.1 polypeptide-transport-associated domain protein shlb-type [Mesorhizobium sp. WSM3864]